MKQAIRQIIREISQGKYLEIYVSGIVGNALAILDGINVLPVDLSDLILVVLSIFIFSIIPTRRKLDELSQAINQLQPPTVPTLQDRSAFRPFKERLVGINDIRICGPSIVNIFLPNSSLLFQKIKRGADVRVLIFHPDSEHLLILAEQLRTPPDQVRREIKAVIGLCEDLVTVRF